MDESEIFKVYRELLPEIFKENPVVRERREYYRRSYLINRRDTLTLCLLLGNIDMERSIECLAEFIAGERVNTERMLLLNLIMFLRISILSEAIMRRDDLINTIYLYIDYAFGTSLYHRGGD